MLLILGAVAVGVALGLVFGGTLRNLGQIHLRWWPLAFVGLILQVIPVPSRPGRVDHWIGVGLLMASFVVLLVFVGANVRRPGVPLIAVGFALNLLVIAVNGGMPVGESALRAAAGDQYRQTLRHLTEGGGAKHHLERPDDVLLPLADVIPLGPPLRSVLSVGDTLWLLGGAWVVAAATRRPFALEDPRYRGRHRTGEAVERKEPAGHR